MQSPPTEFTPQPPARVCLNHPQASTDKVCGQCGQPFCGDCLVDIQGRSLCATCKTLSLRDMQRKVGVQNKLAHDSFVYSLVGLVLCGPVLQPMALVKGIQALKQYKEDPTLPDRWKAVTGVTIASIVCAFYVLYFGFLIVYGIFFSK
jgi:hypothetical protein